RSISMNAFVGGFWDGTWWGEIADRMRTWRVYRKIDSFDQPSLRWVFVDEFPLINDGHLVHLMPIGTTKLPTNGSMNDCPAAYHNGSGALSFADGHSEIHKWKDANTVKRTTKPLDQSGPSPNDYLWLAERTTGSN